jgi:hypothetical protein
LPHAGGAPFELEELAVRHAGKVNYRPRRIAEATAERFATAD